ncbi:MAG: hypothetical protein HZC49_07415 [Nitrospirae bacterium]|nr:hypothetical protein [Nitrospirota bacterium]
MERSARIGSLKSVIRALDIAAGKAGVNGLKVIICGGLAAIAYGMPERATLDIDAEIDTGYEVISKLKKGLEFPAEFTADISRWSMIDIPEGYRERAVPYNEVRTKHVHVFLLSPIDLIISKLRVFRDKDIDDAVFLIKKFRIKKSDILKAAEDAIKTSPASTEILRFKKMVAYFIKQAYPKSK